MKHKAIATIDGYGKVQWVFSDRPEEGFEDITGLLPGTYHVVLDNDPEEAEPTQEEPENGAWMWLARSRRAWGGFGAGAPYLMSESKIVEDDDGDGDMGHMKWHRPGDGQWQCMAQMHRILAPDCRLDPGEGPIRVFFPEARRAKEGE